MLAELDKTGSYSPADIGWRIGQAVSLGVPLVPLILVGLGFWFGFLPGFKPRSAAGSQA
ncbi:hypothetical protein [Steroidobacter agaridevorans]|uniref:hypothetical protein n=1 Tax=Steroidobacter agaridevorans TaxID=2695856 RepID=UPI001379C755|nr:hypothetical protein [Steroidobacter agaridevorans]